MKTFRSALFTVVVAASLAGPLAAQPTRQTETYRRVKAYLDDVPAIDTHDHLWPFEKLSHEFITADGPGVNLAMLWHRGYYPWTNPITMWKPGMAFDDWWAAAKDDFVNARATSFYQYNLSAFTDLYGVDFETMTDEQARGLDRRIFENYKDRKWLYHVVTERANIELIVNDPYWSRLFEVPDYPFCALVFNVTTLVRGYHPLSVKDPGDSPYEFAKRHDLKIESLDDYLIVLDRLMAERKQAGAVCLKHTLAYERSLRFENVPKERAEKAFGRPRRELSPEEIHDFEDFIIWRLVELAAKYDIPFQIHTGQARIQHSSPMNLVDLIEANPKTKFILFHGGFPWVSETGAIGMWSMQRAGNVWIDSCWLPTISYTMGKRAFHEWLDLVPSNRILWGADANHAEGIYAATAFTRRCLAEVLAEKIDAGDLREEHALHVGRQILRENALELFPSLRDKLWKHKGPLTPPATQTEPRP